MAERKYEELKDFYQEKIKKQTFVINTISNLRLLFFFTAMGFGIFAVTKQRFLLLAMILGIFILLFLPLVILHDIFIKKRRKSNALYKVNKVSLLRCKGEWVQFKDIGEEFIDESHSYSQDLDIFGEGSLFQCINTAVTYLGRIRLAEILTKGGTREEILNRRNAIFELAEKLSWRQAYQAEGRLEIEKMLDPEELFRWAKEEDPVYRNHGLFALVTGIPLITIGLLLWILLHPNPNYYIIVGALVIQMIIVYAKFRKRAEVLDRTHKFLKNIRVYKALIHQLETETFGSKHLNDLKTSLLNKKGKRAYEQINKLGGLVDLISNRSSELYVIINVLFLLDFQFMFALERWKRNSGPFIEEWLKAVAEVEALASLAILKYDHPDWATPEILAGNPAYTSKKLGHPLLYGKCVRNDLNFGDRDMILLITGSNMSGKSTMLRTAGINLVLAYAGAPVCAEEFKCSVMEVFSCMRVHDNLEKNISSFYAELLRIKHLVKSVGEGKRIFFLLDEIFKGTNSRDRHTGARMLIKKLSTEKVLGLVSTHDLELCDLDFEIDQVKNYHFQEFYKNNEIMFDYLLREGISKTQNAEYLMKMAGIVFDEK